MGVRSNKLILALMAAGTLCLAIPHQASAQPGDSPDPQLMALAGEFYAWQSANQPSGPFALVRVDRPPDWQPDWSRAALQLRKSEFLAFQARQKSLNMQLTPTADLIDAALLGSSMARVYWELELLARHRRDPGFALDQSLGSIFELLIQNPEPKEEQLAELIVRLKRFPAIINAAKLGLDATVPALADATISKIGDVDTKIDDLEQALVSYVPEELEEEFTVGFRAARQSLFSYKDWLTLSRERFNASVAIGAPKLHWYLGHVALVSRSPDSIIVETELALAQTGAQLALDRQRFSEVPEETRLERLDRLLLMFEISRSELDTYLGTAGLISNPEESAGLEYSALPPGLEPIANMGELTSFKFKGGTGNRYLHEPGNSDNYLENVMWVEPRLLLAWENKPGFATQGSRAMVNPRPIRRRATDVAMSKGVSLYFHEQFLKAGLYAFKPVSHQLAVNFLAYRAALAQADIRIARGEWSFEQAVEFLHTNANREQSAAVTDVQGLIANPGIAAASFAVFGQIVRFLADESRLRGDEFSLKAFNDRLLLNAHVPVALQRWEHLELEDELDKLLEQRGRPATVPQ